MAQTMSVEQIKKERVYSFQIPTNAQGVLYSRTCIFIVEKQACIEISYYPLKFTVL